MEPQRLAMEFEKVPNVPITVNLLTTEICGIAGESDKTAVLIKLMLLQLVTHHGYDDVRVIVLAAEDELEKWDWLKFVPHLWDDGFNIRFLLCGKAIAHQTLSEIYGSLKEREMRSLSGGVLPHYLFIVEDASLLENELISKYLYNGSVKLGVSTLYRQEFRLFAHEL